MSKKVKINDISNKITESTKHSGYSVYIPESAKKKVNKKPKKSKVEKKTRKNAPEKPHNMGKWTVAKYFGTIRSSLRRAFRYYAPMQEALNRASRPYVGTNKLQKKEFQCNECKQWFKRADVEIDHILELGELRCYDDIVPFIKKLTTEDPNDYQILCKPHHLVKTHAARDKRKELRTKNKENGK